MRYCTVKDCKNKHAAKGLCQRHYMKLWITPEYMAWRSMKVRCYQRNNKQYKDWGGRGITVCDDWKHSFQEFHKYVGDKPTSQHSLDRIDNDGNYEPGNVRWATARQQVSNRRNNVGYPGIIKRGNKWQSRIGINGKDIYLGMFDSLEEAINDRKKLEIL